MKKKNGFARARGKGFCRGGRVSLGAEVWRFCAKAKEGDRLWGEVETAKLESWQRGQGGGGGC